MKKTLEEGEEIYSAIIDLRAAFDTVEREKSGRFERLVEKSNQCK